MTAASPAGDGVLIYAMYRALKSVGCRCEHNVPYAGCKVPQVATKECARCRCIREYEEMQSPPSSPTRIEQSSVGCRGDAAGGGP